MKKISTISCLIVTMTVALSFDTAAQQNVRVQKSKGLASLATSLNQLSQELKDSVAIEFRQWYGPRKTYVRLKQRDGCNISFQVSQVPSNGYVNQSNNSVPDLSYGEWRLNLSDLDLAEVKIEIPTNGDYRIIRFATIASKESIKWTGSGVEDAGWVSFGRINIGKKHARQVAAALGQAINACRE